MPGKKFCITLIILLFSCSDKGIEDYAVEVIDGVKYVHNLNSTPEEKNRIEINFVKKYGGIDNADEELRFYNPVDVTVDREGDIFVVDQGNFRIVKISDNGVSVFGSQGNGPGEFIRPWDINPDKNGNLLILDNRKLHHFTTGGKLIQTQSLSLYFSSM
jgi:hypothetical protein